jgi:TolB-like protein
MIMNNMKRIYLRTTIIFLLLLLFLFPITSQAGQVITSDVRAWAQKALEEEGTLKAPIGRNTLAVLYFLNKTDMPELNPVQKGLALMLTTDLSTVKGIQVIERVKLQALVEEMGLGTSGLVEPDTAPRVGKLLGAERLLGGNISAGQQAQVLQIQSTLLNVPSQEIQGQPMVKGKLSNLFILEKDLLFEIIKLLQIELKPEERERLRKPCSTNMSALMSLFNGIEESDKGEYEKAAGFYEQGLKEDPDICIAHDAIKELKALGLIASKRSRSMLQSIREETSLTDQMSPEESIKRERTPGEVRPPSTSTDIIIHFP